MNWIRENKFLTCFIAVLVIGSGVLGYLLFTAWSAYSEVSDQYTAQADSLHQLQTRVPYPDQANLARYRAEIDDLVDATHGLASNLAQMVLPVTPLTPSGFQDRLRDISSAIATKARNAGVKIPEHFALDFDRYQSQPPPKEAASALARQLEALNIVVNILIDEHVDDIASLQRTHLPQEGTTRSGGSGAGAAGRFGQRGDGETAGEATANLVEKIPFEIRFTASQPAFQKVLNDLAASRKQFFIARALVVDNTNPKPVLKATAAEASAPAGAQMSPPSSPGGAHMVAPGFPGGPQMPVPGFPPGPQMPAPGSPGGVRMGAPGFPAGAQMPAPGSPAGAQMAPSGSPGESGSNYLSFIVGTEKLNIAMQIDVATFNPPEKAVRKGAAGPASH